MPVAISRKHALLGLGSNLGDRAAHIHAAAAALGANVGTRLLALSPLVETAPVGCAVAQPDFLNAAAAVETSLAPEDLLALCLAIETARGRERPFPNAPRTLDIDLLFYEGETRSDPRLALPHPRWAQRDFVRRPLAALLAMPPLVTDLRWDTLRRQLASTGA
ncbi:MAG: 2-amino-4-hydroxy-6-hydroxymethyldihydropteridine diphosphokinase [Puniceicoccales bacterium]|jgi:2-amino-4-hydroxy-6-hydroxymethyldihydropteridine diphosphokinase|nr:2-amino-4-hydroxy-6-hydroxymethyldihydropteridine diphosphokinase [Puniceicoccales bacterium]